MPRLSKIGAAALAAFGWTGLQTVTASYLQVAGGGGGGSGDFGSIGGAGGGAGGYLTGTTSLNSTQSYTVVVGAGGAGGVYSGSGVSGVQGSNSQFGALTASVGGGFGAYGTSGATGGNGGSGGGGTFGNAGGTATSGQGSNGGTGSSSLDCRGSGGGGGASAAGSNGSSSGGGNGGNGTPSSISGTSVTYAGGGGGGALYRGGGFTVPTVATGGTGGGGNSGAGTGGNGNPGTANTGGGGGGPVSINAGTFDRGGNGGSGIVIISYAGAQQFGGGVVTSSGGNTIHTFTTSGTLSPLSQLSASYLIVAGGGGGGSDVGGGGGAGGLLSGSSLTLDTNSIYAVTVGAGGAASTTSANGVSGSSSSFSMVSTTAVGGGGGASAGNAAGSSGGSGGGGTRASGAGGAGTSGQGNNGGSGSSSTGANISAAGGGGGASAVGSNATGGVGGNGGAGTSSSISGTSITYAGGGGGRCDGSGTQGTGGSGGGGNAGTTGVAGTANLGGGGGGGSSSGGNGGSGVVIISYPGSTPQMAGGTVTVSGGNVIHTFTSSGYLSPIVNVNNSLRFRSSASAYLNRTMTTATNNLKWTWSAWVKRGKLADTNIVFGAGDGTSNNFGAMQFTSGDVIQFAQINGGSYNVQVTTNAVFRDPSAWYHVVLVYDSPNATSTDRVQIYVNGARQSVTYATGPFTQNTSSSINSALAHYISKLDYASLYFDGYMAEINFVDGQALTPFSFGSFNGLGVWQPVRYGGSYGTNGFYLPFNAGTSSFAGLFNGSSQYLSTTSGITNQFTPTSGFTLEMWLNPSNTNTAQVFYVGGGSNSWSATNGYLFGLLLGSGGNYQWQWNNAGATFTLSFPDLSTNRWSHVAIGYNGTTTRIWVNGVSAGTSTNPYTVPTTVNQYVIGSSFGGAANFYSGQLSNLRFVKGTDVYGVANANISVPTSPLTAIANTQLLTLQNSTIIDNSTNAFSITNNGTVTTGQTYPCSTAIFNDQGPAGNNWTPNNISGAFGSTLDYMTDVPTNTSATVANYAVWNPLDKGTVTVTNANLSAVSAADTHAIRASMGLPLSGKFYWETTVSGLGYGSSLGIANATSILTTGASSPETRTYQWGSWFNTFNSGIVQYGTNQTLTGGTNWSGASQLAANDVLMIAVDMDNGSMWVGKNGTWFNSSGTANPATNTDPRWTGLTGTTWFPYYSGYGSVSPVTANINFGQQPFTYTPPSGFVALNTFNLPTPTIGATPATTANKYFNVVTWTGNGTSSGRSITGVGFQPDFVWGKPRSLSYTHSLSDAVRGANKRLNSGSTSTEDTNFQYGYTSSFDTDGFTTSAGSSSNENWNTTNETFVAWNWKANGSGSTNTAGSIISTVSSNATAGFSIVTYTGNGTASTVGHGLLVGGVATAPSMIIIKDRDNGTYDWNVYHASLSSPTTLKLYLNTTDAENNGGTNSGTWNSTAPTPTVFSLGTFLNVNNSGDKFVAYCFAQVAGYSAFGSYTGNNASDGTFVYLGFRPKFIMIKSTSAGTEWVMVDSTRSTYNLVDTSLYANRGYSESTIGTVNDIDFLSNGFKLRNNTGYVNSSQTYIYMAFAESPFKYANAR